MKSYYKRNLPHIQPADADVFITFRLYGSLPKAIIDELMSEYKQLKSELNFVKTKKVPLQKLTRQNQIIIKYDEFLHKVKSGPHHLKIPELAKLIADQLHRFDDVKYTLKAYCIMSNHVHILINPLRIKENEFHSLESIMHSIKSYTSNKANEILNRTGSPFWTEESFDHYARNETESRKIAEYILNNPVQAGIVKTISEWKWNYLMDGFLD